MTMHMTVPGSEDLFRPDPERARAVDATIRQRLADSLDWLDVDGVSAATVPDGWTARPTDFGFYYDLAAAKHHGVEPSPAAADSLRASLTRGGGATGALRMTTLDGVHYAPDEIDCLKRWFDLEPDNAMALEPLGPEALTRETEAVGRALAILERHAPALHGEFAAITTELIFAKPGEDARFRFGGASSFSLWGGMALSPHEVWWHYVPRLVHEYSHNLLFGLAADGPLVLNDPAARYHSPLRGTQRPMDGIFHAFYVTGREAVLRRTLIDALGAEAAGSEDIAGLRDFCARTLPEAVAAHEDCHDVVAEHAALSDLGRTVVASTRAAMRSEGLIPAG